MIKEAQVRKKTETMQQLQEMYQQNGRKSIVYDAFRSYLNQIGQFPLLTKEQEIYYARQVQQGSQSAKLKMMECNLRLVVSIAKGMSVKNGLDILDLIDEGNIGLEKAVRLFDPDKQCRFSTYATWWIKQSISRAIDNTQRTVRLPVHIKEKIKDMNQVERDLDQRLGRHPTDQEMATALNSTEQKISELKRIAFEPISLQTPLNEQEDASLAEYIRDDKIISPEKYVETQTIKEEVLKAIRLLTERERFVIVYRFGFDQQKVYTLEEIGNELGVTRERVRQIEANALRKLKNNQNLKRLEDDRKE